MARATHLTISTADRIRLDGRGGEESDDGKNEVRQEVQVSVTYALDPGDTDLVLLADRKALEVKLAHEAVWNRIGAFSAGAFVGASDISSCSGRSEADGADEYGDDQGGDDGPEGGSDEDPLAGLPSCGDDPFGGGPAQAGAARPFPAPATAWGARNGDSGPIPEPADAPDAEPLTGPQKILIRSRARKIGLTPYALDSLVFQQFKVWKIERLSKHQADALLAALERDLKEKEKNSKEGVPHADRNGRAATA